MIPACKWAEQNVYAEENSLLIPVRAASGLADDQSSSI